MQKVDEPKCWACEAEISESQKICLNCKSWQNWRRYLILSNTTLSLLIALASVSSLFISPLIGFMRVENHLLRGKVLVDRSGIERLTISVRNLGDIPVFFPEVIECRRFKQGHEDHDEKFQMITVNDGYVPNDPRSLVELTYTPIWNQELFSNQFDFLCEVGVANQGKNPHPPYHLSFGFIGVDTDQFGSFVEGPAPVDPYSLHLRN